MTETQGGWSHTERIHFLLSNPVSLSIFSPSCENDSHPGGFKLLHHLTARQILIDSLRKGLKEPPQKLWRAEVLQFDCVKIHSC